MLQYNLWLILKIKINMMWVFCGVLFDLCFFFFFNEHFHVLLEQSVIVGQN